MSAVEILVRELIHFEGTELEGLKCYVNLNFVHLQQTYCSHNGAAKFYASESCCSKS